MKNSRVIRVLQVVYKMDRAGAETLLMQIYRNIDRTKVQFDFLVHTLQSGHYDDEICSLGGKIINMPVLPAENYLLYTKTLKNIFLHQGPYTCVHSHLALLSGVIVGTAHSANVPCRLVHSHNANDGKANSFSRRVYRWYMRHQIRRYATHMLAVSQSAGEWLFGKNCWQDSRVQILNNALDLKPYEMLSRDRPATRRSLDLPIDGILIGHIGRFVPSKNHRKLLDIFQHLAKMWPTAHLILVGEGPLEHETGSLIKSYGLQDRAHMLGVRSDIPEIMAALDLFLFPSLHEGLGIVLIEAQAAGVPCLVSDTIPFEVDLGLGLVNFLPLSASSKTWAETILALLNNSRPPWPAREKALKNHNYDIAELTPKLQDLYSYEPNTASC